MAIFPFLDCVSTGACLENIGETRNVNLDRCVQATSLAYVKQYGKMNSIASTDSHRPLNLLPTQLRPETTVEDASRCLVCLV